ncbi:hypothetical protein, partial [Nodularia spumigena]|uniref:hypothetical protein n=1 Tax=Nodularia spumigena TaxID=70799 RepID=UPI002B20C9AC
RFYIAGNHSTSSSTTKLVQQRQKKLKKECRDVDEMSLHLFYQHLLRKNYVTDFTKWQIKNR